MRSLLVIAGAGAVGAVLRYLVSTGVHRIAGRDFPYGTLVVNAAGSFLIGYFFVLLLERSMLSDTWRLAILVGLLGSFTTFSTFSLETLGLVSGGWYGRAVANVALSLGLCLGGTWIGMSLARAL